MVNFISRRTPLGDPALARSTGRRSHPFWPSHGIVVVFTKPITRSIVLYGTDPLILRNLNDVH